MSPNPRRAGVARASAGLAARRAGVARASAGLTAMLAAVAALSAGCGSGGPATAQISARWVSRIEKGCATTSSASIEVPVAISSSRIALPGSCTIDIDEGSLTLTGVDANVGTLGFVLSAHARLVIDSSTLSGSSEAATMTVTSSGNGQTVSLSGDNLDLGRGVLVEVGLGTAATSGATSLSVTGTTIVAEEPGGLGAEFLSKGPSRFSDDDFEVPGYGTSASIRSASPAQCHVSHVRGLSSTGCASLG